MKKNVLLALVCCFLGLVSCKNSYQRLLKSGDYQLKYTKAIAFYTDKKYDKAAPLLEELMAVYRGTEKAEQVYYYYAYNEYKQTNYLLASYHFKTYCSTFPKSERLEEMSFMYAYCLYKESPEYSLDQSSTLKAVEALQLFANKFPASTRLKECNELVDKLRDKLEKKAYESAMLFYQMDDYRAAAVALQNALKEYPDIDDREYLEFLVVESYYNFALNSIPEKQLERYEKALDSYKYFSENFSKSQYLKEAKKYSEKSKKEINRLEILEKTSKNIVVGS